jgi:hypothetical protein
VVLDAGRDLDLDVLPAVRDLVAAPGQPPLRNWGVPWLAKEIIRRGDARTEMGVEDEPGASKTRQAPPFVPSLSGGVGCAGAEAGLVGEEVAVGLRGMR